MLEIERLIISKWLQGISINFIIPYAVDKINGVDKKAAEALVYKTIADYIKKQKEGSNYVK